MMQSYMRTKNEYKDCILFYRLGDFYEMFFDDAQVVSKELELTLTGKACGLEERAPMCGVPHHAVDSYLTKLVGRGYKVAICEQVEDPKLAKGLVKREVIRVATPGTIRSGTYNIEIQKLHPDVQVTGQACPLWVPLIENMEHQSPGADYFVRKYIDELLRRDPQIDTIILGCTHYPLLFDKIRQFTPSHIRLISQGDYVAHSLDDYLHRHPDMAQRLTTGGACRFLTTEQPSAFADNATAFLGSTIEAEHISLQ